MCIWYFWLRYLLYLGMLSEKFSLYNIGYVFIPKLGSEGPQLGPVELICLSVCLSLRLSVGSSSLLVGDQRERPIIAHSACGRYLYIWIYICISISLYIYMNIYIYTYVTNINTCISTLDPHTETVFVFISSVGVQCHDALILTLGSWGPQWGPVKLVCLSVFPSVHMSICPSIHLSICPSVHLSSGTSFHLSICLSVRLSLCLSVRSSASLFGDRL